MYDNNKDYPKDIAINYLGRKITYRQLFENIDDTARAFQALEVKPGEIVTVALPSVPEALYVVYALNKIGAVANMIHPLAGREELLHYLNEVKSRIAILFDGTYDILEESIRDTFVEHAVVVSAGISLPFGVRQLYNLNNKKKYIDNGIFTSWKEFIRRGANSKLIKVNKDPSTMAIISHTGGTTGEPKGVMCSDMNVNALIFQSFFCFKHDERQHRVLVVLPPFINYSLIQSMLEMLCLGYYLVLLPKYEPNKIVDYIKKYKPNVILSIPPYWEKVLDLNTNNVDMSCFEQIYYGGEAMSEKTEQAINTVLKRCGSKVELLKGLGSTELMAVASQTYPWCNEIGSVGIPLINMNCKIVNPGSYDELKIEEQGELCFSGPTLMMGYYDNPDETNVVIKTHKDGVRWLHTGDLGYINKNGIIFITGRIKRIVVTKGKDGIATKMFPDRIEDVINKHPSVRLSCIIGVPDKDRINYPKAIIELNDGCAPSKDLEKGIIQFCNGKLPDYQIPDEIEFRDALPRTDRGKIDYRALEDEAK